MCSLYKRADKYYRGKFKPVNIKKYSGDPTMIIYRSSWELLVMKWCDSNQSVTSWCSEETVIPYKWPFDNYVHNYHVDFRIEFTDGSTHLVEIKPDKETKLPDTKGKRHTRYLREQLTTYVKNTCKWQAAKRYAEQKGWTFSVWTEKTLKNLGILR